MSPSKHIWPAAVSAVLLAGTQLTPSIALADPQPPAPQPEMPAQPESQPQPDQGLLHNITYRARIDGVSRGATITYTDQGDRVQTTTPTMTPGRVFEVNTVLPASKTATMRVAVDWPYSANLHCEILLDDQLVAQADDFAAPRLTPDKQDPDYGSLSCEAPVGGTPAPGDPAAPPAATPLPAGVAPPAA